MSHSGLPGTKQLAKIGKAGVGLVEDFVGGGIKEIAGAALGGLGLGKVPDLPNPAAVGGPSDASIAARATEQFATREQTIRQAAAAAGAQRSDNEADLLGYSTPKPKAARRALLG